MVAKLDNAVFDGSMFFFLVPGPASKLTDLLLEFEIALLGAPPRGYRTFILGLQGLAHVFG